MNRQDGDTKHDEYLARVTQLDYFIRGSTLNHSTIIEHSIGRIISYHFLMEKGRRNLFFSLIMNDTSMSFSRKISILNDLLHICFPDILKRNGRIINNLRKIMQWRNLLSHSNSLMTKEILHERDFTKVYYSHYTKDVREEISVSADDFQKQLNLMDKVIKRLQKIEAEIIELNGIVDDSPTGRINNSPLVQVFK